MSKDHWSNGKETSEKRSCNGCRDDCSDVSYPLEMVGCYQSAFPPDMSILRFDLCEHCLSAIVATLDAGPEEFTYPVCDENGGTEVHDGNAWRSILEVRAGRLLFHDDAWHKRWLSRVKESPFYRRGSMRAVEYEVAVRVEVESDAQWDVARAAAPWLDFETRIDRVAFVWRREHAPCNGYYDRPGRPVGPPIEQQKRALDRIAGVKTWWSLRNEADKAFGENWRGSKLKGAK